MRALEGAGIFRVWTARRRGRVIGFILFHIHPHLNYRHTLFAFDGGHYLDTTYRDNGWLGIKMWRSAIAALRDLGVRVVMAHDNSQRPLGPFFRRLGFEPRSTIYWKVLDAE